MSTVPASVQSNTTTAVAENVAPKPTFRTVLAQAPIRTLWLASLISYLGDTFGTMALFILVNNTTGSTAALGAVAFVQSLPLFLGLIAGVLVDRWHYRPVLLIADILRAIFLPLYLLVFHSAANLWMVLSISFCFALTSRFFTPASQALRRALVQPEEYSITASLWQTTMGLSYVVGPALAGLTIATFGQNGIVIAILIDSISFLVSALLIFMGVREAAIAIDNKRRSEERPTPWEDLKDGIQVMWGSRAIRGSLVLYALGLLGVGAMSVLTVPYVQRIFQGGSLQIGLLDTAEAFGLALGAAVVGTIAARRFPLGNLMLGASLVGALSIIALGIAPIYLLAAVAMMFAGGAAGTLQSAAGGLMLHTIPQNHQGKASAAQNTLLNATYLTSIALAGWGGDAIGIQGMFVLGGTIALLGVVCAAPLLWGSIPPKPRTQSQLKNTRT